VQWEQIYVNMGGGRVGLGSGTGVLQCVIIWQAEEWDAEDTEEAVYVSIADKKRLLQGMRRDKNM
jgi:hypothetical protein